MGQMLTPTTPVPPGTGGVGSRPGRIVAAQRAARKGSVWRSAALLGLHARTGRGTMRPAVGADVDAMPGRAGEPPDQLERAMTARNMSLFLKKATNDELLAFFTELRAGRLRITGMMNSPIPDIIGRTRVRRRERIEHPKVHWYFVPDCGDPALEHLWRHSVIVFPGEPRDDPPRDDPPRPYTWRDAMSSRR